jgi:hypothetical protein
LSVVARGVHFALTEIDERRLLDCPEAERVSLIGDDIENRYFTGMQEWVCETDKAWDAIHRAFNDSALDYEYRSPLHGVILGGRPLYSGEDYIISYKDKERVREIAPALVQVDQPAFRELYFKIDPQKYDYPLSEEDFEYSWDWLSALKEFYERAARYERPVIFTTDQ